MSLLEKTAYFFATGCLVGTAPVAPGTLGALVAMPLCFYLSGLPVLAAVGICGILIVGAIWVADRTAILLQSADPGCVVIDEIVGMAVTLVALPFNTMSVITGFLLFRALDILKPFPIRWIDRHVSGGWGIVMDDVVAGIAANFILRGFFHLGWLGNPLIG